MWNIYDTQPREENCVVLHCPNCGADVGISTKDALFMYCPYCGYANGNHSDLIAYNMPDGYDMLDWKDF